MKIGVLGLGLIGGSIFKKLSEIRNYEALGVSRSVKGENIYEDWGVLKECKIIFVCTPMNKTVEILEKLDGILNSDTIVSDVCSLKGFVSKGNYGFKFIPSHPMAGTEKSGWENSFSKLFEGAKWAVTPIKSALQADVDLLGEVIRDLGAEPIITTAEEHDRAAALISHAPLVIAQALCKSIENNSLAQMLASSGFRDTTRLALSNTEMANDMLNFNRDNIEYALEVYNKSIKELLGGDYKALAEEIQSFRNNLYGA